MMTKDEILLRLRFVKARLRNISYYWHYDESLGESRERKQYIHVLRETRKQCQALIQEMGENPIFTNESLWLTGIVGIISPKVKKEECGNTIKLLEKYVK